MEKNSQYSILSKYYDQIILDENYLKMVSSIISLVKKYANGNKGVDCCCGTGIVTRELKKNGYSVNEKIISIDECVNELMTLFKEHNV